MDWVRDPKNQKFVVPIALAIIIGVGVFYYFKVIAPPASAPATDATAPAGTNPSGASGVAPAPQPSATTTPPAVTSGAVATTPGVTAQAPAGPAAGNLQVAKVTPMETWRGDPFQPIGYKPPPKGPRPKPPILDFPFDKLPGVSISRVVQKEQPEIQQPPRRMAGILLNDRVYAIIESNGASQVVQPGDYLLDRLASVERIEPGKVVLKTVDKKPRYIIVRMAASAHQNVTNVTVPTAPTAPGFAPPPPGMPRMRPGANPLAPP